MKSVLHSVLGFWQLELGVSARPGRKRNGMMKGSTPPKISYLPVRRAPNREFVGAEACGDMGSRREQGFKLLPRALGLLRRDCCDEKWR